MTPRPVERSRHIFRPSHSIRAFLPCLLLLSILLSGCAGPQAATGPGAASPPGAAPQDQVATILFFGMSTPDGGEVSEPQWQRFLDEVVTPRFGGLTAVDADGQYVTAAGRIEKEPSKMLIIVHAAADAGAIEEVRRIYCERFNQQSVLKVTLRGEVSF